MISPTLRRGMAAALLTVLPLAATISGCGGTSAARTAVSPASGRAVIAIEWPRPAPSRLIPAATGSVRVTFLTGETQVRSALVTRSAGAAVGRAELDLPAGNLTVRAEAFPTFDGSGVPVASAQTTVTIVAGQRTPVSLTLQSTIARLTILPENIPFSTDPVTITAVAYDARGQVIVSGSFEWSVAPAGIISLDPNGATATVRATGEGTATLTVRETESGQTFDRVFTVTPVAAQ